MSPRADLLRSPLFKDVPENAISMVEAAVTERQYAAGEVIVSQEAQGEALFLIAEGEARVVRVSLGGRERLLAFLYAPSVFGEIAVLATHERSATVIAETPVRALMLYREEFEQLLHRYPRVLLNLARVLAERIHGLNDELIAMGVSTEAAMAHVCVGLYRQRLAAGVRDPEALPLNQTDLMLRLSSSRETVARVVRRLEKEGYLTFSGGVVRLRNVDGLEQLVHGLV